MIRMLSALPLIWCSVSQLILIHFLFDQYYVPMKFKKLYVNKLICDLMVEDNGNTHYLVSI